MRSVNSLLTLVLLLSSNLRLVSQPAPAPAAIPETPAGQVLGKWLAAFNSGDRDQLTAFVTTYNPRRLKNIDDEMDFRRQTGGFNLVKIETSSDLEIAAIVKERGGDNFARLSIKVGESAPHLIENLSLRVTDPPAGASSIQRLPDPEAAAAWKQQFSALAADGKFAGAYLWARNNSIIASGAEGLADREKNIPNTLETQFRIGSMNKMFTSVAALQLVAQGKLALDTPIAKYLPDYPNKELASKVTLRHLLTHTGGTGDFFGPEFDQHRLELRTLKDYVHLFGARALKFEPGSQWEYSNYGFLLVGVLIEAVSGESYYDYVRKHIFAPAGMSGTDSLPEIEPVAHRAAGYMQEKGEWRPNADTLPWRGTSAGGGYSTVGDLLKFAYALLDHKLLSAELLDQATTAQKGTPGYGFGFGVDDNPVKSFGHTGGAPGMNGGLRIYPQSRTVIAVLSNLDPPAATKPLEWLERRLTTN
jgi:CubicO group peptidase (beta-lactamase class C family)